MSKVKTERNPSKETSPITTALADKPSQEHLEDAIADIVAKLKKKKTFTPNSSQTARGTKNHLPIWDNNLCLVIANTDFKPCDNDACKRLL